MTRCQINLAFLFHGVGKCDGFPCSDVLNTSYGRPKSTESEILSSSSKIGWRPKKKTWPQFSKLRLHIESA